MGGKQLALHHRIDRRVAGQRDQGEGDQGEGGPGVAGAGQAGEQGIGQHRQGSERSGQQHLAPNPVADPAEQRVDQQIDHQRAGADLGGLVLGEVGRVGQELLHVGGEGVEGERAGRGQDEDHPGLHRVVDQQQVGGRAALALGLGGVERAGLVQAPLDPEHHHRQGRADEERHAPAPVAQLRLGQHVLQHDQHPQRQQLAADYGDELERRPEAATLFPRHLGHVGGAGAVFAADAEALQQPRGGQDGGRGRADARIARNQGHDQRAQAHQRHRQDQRRLAPRAVGVEAHDPGPHRAGQEAHREDGRGLQQLGGLVPLGEEHLGEIEGEGGVGEPVVPLDQVAG